MAACCSADPDGTVRLPFAVATGRMVEDVWERWLEHDPVAGHFAIDHRYPLGLRHLAERLAPEVDG